MLTMELDRANVEIQRLKKLLKRPSDGSDVSNLSTGSSQMLATTKTATGKPIELAINPATLMYFGEESPAGAQRPTRNGQNQEKTTTTDFHVFSANQ
jgi:hypothetical protein